MRFLQSERDVETRYGGRFVQAIDGLEGEGPDGRRDWFYFVNGIEADIGAAEYELSPGDVVQWDNRRWDAAMRVPGIVGAFPEPFLHGSGGTQLPTRVECEDDESDACQEVKRRLGAEGVTVTSAPLGAAAGSEVLRVVVAKWPAARHIQALAPLEDGPSKSGVFARPASDGKTLVLLDDAGREALTAGLGTGLIAATALAEQQVVWLVTGTDDAGLEAAARSVDDEVLRDAFAVAVTIEGPIRLPLVEEAAGPDVTPPAGSDEIVPSPPVGEEAR